MVLRPLRLFCDYCDRYIPSDIEWTCGYCAHTNVGTRIYSFLNKCKECKRSPKSYVCPHCGKLVYLDTDEDGSHPASKTSVPIPPETREQIRLRRREAHEDTAEQLNQGIVIAKLNSELARWQAKIEASKPKSRVDQLEREFANRKATTMGVYEIADREYALNASLYKNNPNRKEQADAVVRVWLEDKAQADGAS